MAAPLTAWMSCRTHEEDKSGNKAWEPSWGVFICAPQMRVKLLLQLQRLVVEVVLILGQSAAT